MFIFVHNFTTSHNKHEGKNVQKHFFHEENSSVKFLYFQTLFYHTFIIPLIYRKKMILISYFFYKNMGFLQRRGVSKFFMYLRREICVNRINSSFLNDERFNGVVIE